MDAPNTLFSGLLGDARVRVKGLAVWGRGREDRTDSFTPVLRGVKDVVCGVDQEGAWWPSPGVLKFSTGCSCVDVENILGDVEAPGVGDDCGVVEGEPSAEDPEAVRTKPNRDGDLDMDWRKDLALVVTSMWWT